MNENNTPIESSPEQPESQVPSESTTDPSTTDPSTTDPSSTGTSSAPPTAAGHEMPPSFASQAAAASPGQPVTLPSGHGAAFGIPAPTQHTQPTEPLSPYAAGTETLAPVTNLGEKSDRERKPFGAGKVAALILAAALVGGASGLGSSYLGNTLWAQPTSSSAEGPNTVTVNNPGSVNETTAIATKVLPSVVTIEVAGADSGGSGSGVILSEDGYVLTNTHVVTLGGAAQDPTIRVTTSDGHIYEATIVGTDPVYDLAVIKLKDAEGLSPMKFADSSEINVGSTAVAVGAPLGLANSVTTGIVSALNRSIEIASSAAPDSTEGEAPEDDGESGEGGPFQFDLPGQENQAASQTISIAVIQTDAAINPGNSGGALVDSEGNLIGINVAIATAGSSEESGSIGVGFAIPSNVAQRVADEIISSGAATHGLLGASVRDASSVEGADVSGAYIVETTDGGGAKAGGLQKGDVVTEFNGVPITGASDLTAQVRAAAAGSDADVSYVRDGRSFEIEVTLGELAL